MLDFDIFQYVSLIVYLDSLLFMSELFGFVNSRHFCYTEDVKNNRSSGLNILTLFQSRGSGYSHHITTRLLRIFRASHGPEQSGAGRPATLKNSWTNNAESSQDFE